jgi:hypothetical protein
MISLPAKVAKFPIITKAFLKKIPFWLKFDYIAE